MVLPVARLAKLVRHLTVAPEAVAAAPLVESTRQDEERALPMLSGQQMADFISKGYVLVQPNEGEGQELPAQFHASFYDRVEDLMRNPVHEGHRDLGQMTQEINQLLRAPSCHGALRSILGEGFSVASWGNGTPLLHNPQDTDQGWHKDGTDHGNTQSTVRDLLPRHVIMFYYAQDTTLDMGPTSILPGSQYYSVDRLGAGSSEHSLATDLYDNRDEDLARRDAGIQSAGAILSHGLDHAKALREERMASKVQTAPGMELFQEKKLTVPAGTLAIVHTPRTFYISRDYLDAPLFSSFSLRVTNLGAGLAAVPGLQSMVADPPKMNGVTELTEAYSNKLLGETTWEQVALDIHIAVDAMYCLGQCTISPGTQITNHAEWLSLATSVVECCRDAIERCSAELAEFIATRPPIEGEGLVFYALERRRLLAEACNTIGLVGAEAVGMETGAASELVVRSCEVLHPLACMAKDQASVYASFMYPTTVQTNAAQALMRLCSVGGCSDAIVMHAPNSGNSDSTGQLDFDNLVGGMVCEARDRLRNICNGRGKGGWVVTPAQIALRQQIENDLSWPWKTEDSRLYEKL